MNSLPSVQKWGDNTQQMLPNSVNNLGSKVKQQLNSVSKLEVNPVMLSTLQSVPVTKKEDNSVMLPLKRPTMEKRQTNHSINLLKYYMNAFS